MSTFDIVMVEVFSLDESNTHYELSMQESSLRNIWPVVIAKYFKNHLIFADHISQPPWPC